MSGRAICVASMRPIITVVIRSVVCMSVCRAHVWVVQKRLNLSRCRLDLTGVDPRNQGFDKGRDSPTRGGQFWGCLAYWKALESSVVYAAKWISSSSITTAMLLALTGQCHIAFSLVKNPPCDAAFCQNSLTTFFMQPVQWVTKCSPSIFHCAFPDCRFSWTKHSLVVVAWWIWIATLVRWTERSQSRRFL